MSDEAKNTVPLREYLESKIAAQEHAVSVAREELNHWKESHNQWQAQMREANAKFVEKSEYMATLLNLTKRLESCERLVYIGIGLALAFQVGVLLVKKP